MGAVMPIVVSIFTPLPLAGILVGQMVSKKTLSCRRKRERKGKENEMSLTEGARKPLTTPEIANNDDDDDDDDGEEVDAELERGGD
ncbi:unnamed protein product [Hydatigera taeniaeformis]|uniref:Uncharacterized protein n=1 Tax=Hydatigena taeniaeformis TaxID=6205 RepID=A0A0R3WXE9_HYDTA|nr:unnamed protein product [Hydatigera taeniaeformis]